MARRRAIVLVTVQLLIIAHIVQWAITGTTTTPVEPSESMQTVTEGVINVGTIFFGLALLSTLIFGRFFCGWGCHVVMLQDFCAWLMKKCGIRPKPFRSRLLVYVPLLLGLYMFVWPLFFRWALVPFVQAMDGWWGAQAFASSAVRGAFNVFNVSIPTSEISPMRATLHLTTDGFWDTFAPWPVAIPFLLVCGFAAVYFLGSKGFCTYGCPYGGFFAPLDELAPGRIRVTDACEHCGHCTAVCTSNVRVHEEVREYGMVVDPGCMKCMDCVSVCPNDALYFGFGKPAVGNGEAKHKTPRKTYDLTWREEIALAGVFGVTFFSVRGVYGLIPMLFAAGIAGCMTFIVWRAWRMFRDENVNLYRWQFKLGGRWRAPGVLFVVATIASSLLVLQSGAVNLLGRVGGWQVDRALANSGDAASQPTEVEFTQRLVAARAVLERARPLREGGIGLATSPRIEQTLAGVCWTLGDRPAAAESALRIVDRIGVRASELDARDLLTYLAAGAPPDQARGYAAAVLEKHPEFHTFREHFINWLATAGDMQQAIAVTRQALAIEPDHLHFLRRLSLLLLEQGELDESIRVIRRTIEIDGSSPYAWFTLARALWMNDQTAEALAALDRAGELAPLNDPAFCDALSQLYIELNAPEKAAIWRGRVNARSSAPN